VVSTPAFHPPVVPGELSHIRSISPHHENLGFPLGLPGFSNHSSNHPTPAPGNAIH
jgi:hypothetical protein